MAKFKIPYPGVNATIPHLKTQILHSLPYVAKNTPPLKTPRAVWDYAKARYTFKSDPEGVELFQTVPTLLKDNEYGAPGHGDCDDATIFILSLLFINGFKGGIVLSGRSQISPTHIYAYCDHAGQRIILDLTNKSYNFERYYPFKQYIPLTIPENQIKMFLQLADSPKRTKRRRLAAPKKSDLIYLPSKKVSIPEHHFDKLPFKEFHKTLLGEGYTTEQLSELSGRRSERKAERKERKKERLAIKKEKAQVKLEKKRAKTDVIKAKAEKKRASGRAKETRAEGRRLRGEGKKIKAERGEGGTFTKLFDTAGNLVKTFVQPDEVEQDEISPEEIEQDFSPEEIEQDFSPEETSPEENLEEAPYFNFFGISLNKPQTTLTGAGLLFAGALIEKRTRRHV